jgi:hypothetical protein
MAFGFPASSKWSQDLGTDPTLLGRFVEHAFDKLKWNYRRQHDTGALVARLPANMLSWGETVTVKVSDAGTVEVESRCTWPMQIFDWERNASNVNRFHAALLHVIRNSDLDKKLPSRSVDPDGTTPLERVIRAGEQEN